MKPAKPPRRASSFLAFGSSEMKDPIVRAQHYRERAARMRAMAETEYDDKSRRDLLALAGQYERLANELIDPPPRFP